MRAGTIAGIAVTVHPGFLAIVLLFAWSGKFGEVCLVFVSVLLHETAHIIVARYCGYIVKAVVLLPFGGVAKIDRFLDGDRQKVFITTLVGPVSSFCLAAVCWGLQVVSPHEFLRTAFEINLLLGGFNLLPAFPLDGSQLLRSLLLIVCSYRQATKCLVGLSISIVICILVKVSYDVIQFGLLNFSLVMLMLFIADAVRCELKHSQFHNVRIMAYKKADLQGRGYLPTDQYTVLKSTPVKAVIHLFQAERYAILIVVDEMHGVCGSVTEFEIWEALGKYGINVRFGDLVI